MKPEEIRPLLEQAGATAVDTEYAKSGTHVDVIVPAEKLRDVVQLLRDQEYLIADLTAVDATPQMMAIYHFNNLEGGCRVTVRALTERATPELASVQDIYPGANWHEREAHDFFGLVFSGHPDLSPLILPEDAGDLRPLLKSEERLKALGDVIPLFTEAPAGDEPTPKSEGEA